MRLLLDLERHALAGVEDDPDQVAREVGGHRHPRHADLADHEHALRLRAIPPADRAAAPAGAAAPPRAPASGVHRAERRRQQPEVAVDGGQRLQVMEDQLVRAALQRRRRRPWRRCSGARRGRPTSSASGTSSASPRTTAGISRRSFAVSTVIGPAAAAARPAGTGAGAGRGCRRSHVVLSPASRFRSSRSRSLPEREPPAEAPPQKTGCSSYSPNTSRSASHISPSVA